MHLITIVLILLAHHAVSSKRKHIRITVDNKRKQSVLSQPRAQIIDIYNGTTFIHERFEDLLKRNPTVPGFQRTLNDERLANFTAKIHAHTMLLQANSSVNPVPFLGLLSIAVLDNKYFIVDGQHRFKALSNFYDATKADFNIDYIQKVFHHAAEIKSYFKEINDVLLVDPSIFSPAREKVIGYLRSTYPAHESTSSKPHFPNVNFDLLFKYISERYGYEDEDDSEKIIQSIENLNADLAEALKVDYADKYSKSFKTDKKLGKESMFTLAHVVHNAASKGELRKKIPAVLRRRVWTEQFGEGIDTGYCNCCTIKVTTSDFHLGHIIAVAKGGTDDINNLKVICAECNLSMGTRNLHEFSERHFSSRLAALRRPEYKEYTVLQAH